MRVVTPILDTRKGKLTPNHKILSIDIIREVNRLPYAQVVLVDGDAAKGTFPLSDRTEFQPGEFIEIKLRREGKMSKEVSVFKGQVIRHRVEAGERCATSSTLTLELKDEAVKLTTYRKSTVYRDQTDADIIYNILDARTPEGKKKPKRSLTTDPKHAELVQYNCTDWDFILSRAEAQGLLVVVNDGKVSLWKMELPKRPIHKLTFGTSEIFSFEMEADGSHQYHGVKSFGWDVKEQKLTKAAEAASFKLEQGDLNAQDIAQDFAATTCTLTNATSLDPKELQAWSDATLRKGRLSLLRGRLWVQGSADYRLMDLLEVGGISKRFNGKTLITGVRHQYDHDGWRTEVQFGLSAKRFAQEHALIDLPAAGLLPAVSGLHIGKVAAFEEDPEKHFRVKVILPGLDEQKHRSGQKPGGQNPGGQKPDGQKPEGAVWARLAVPDAGSGRGWFFRPEEGDEVVVGFLNDDPRQAIILGALFSSTNAPPSGFEVNQKNLKKGIVSKKGVTLAFVDDVKGKDEAKPRMFIQTPAKKKVLLDDKADVIELSDKHGNKITLDKNGVTIKTDKDFKIEAKGNVEIKGAKVDVK